MLRQNHQVLHQNTNYIYIYQWACLLSTYLVLRDYCHNFRKGRKKNLIHKTSRLWTQFFLKEELEGSYRNLDVKRLRTNAPHHIYTSELLEWSSFVPDFSECLLSQQHIQSQCATTPAHFWGSVMRQGTASGLSHPTPVPTLDSIFLKYSQMVVLGDSF